MNQPKRHHIVPQFYLKRFARDELIEVVGRDDFSKVFQTSPQNALVEKQFYTMDVAATGPDLWVEQELFAQTIEPGALRAIGRVIDQGIPVSRAGLRSALAIFIVFQFVRGQATRQPMVEAHKATARMIAQLATPESVRASIRKTEEREPSEAEVQDVIEFAKASDKYDVEITHQNNLHIRFMAEIAPLAEPLFAGSWRVLEFQEPVLITGDEPVGLVGKTRMPGEGIGLLTASEVIFPTDPRHALVITRKGAGPRFARSRGTPEMAHLINRHIAFRCHKYIVRMPDTAPLDGLALPEKAPMVTVEGNMIVSRFGMSKEAAARDMAALREKARTSSHKSSKRRY